MFDTILDNYSKAVESTLRLQQEMLRNWTTLSSLQTQVSELQLTGESTPAGATPAARLGRGLAEQLNVAQERWVETVSDLLNRHRETLDEQYRTGIRAIEDAIRVGTAKDPEQFRSLSEEFWWRSFETLWTAVASQVNDVQVLMQKWCKIVSVARPDNRDVFIRT